MARQRDCGGKRVMGAAPGLSKEEYHQRRREIGQWLKGLRLGLDMTQSELAKAVGMDYYTYLSQFERGDSSVPEHLFAPMAKALKVDRVVFARRLCKAYNPYLWTELFGDHDAAASRRDHETGPAGVPGQ